VHQTTVKTFGWLPLSYYLRNFLVGAALSGIFIFVLLQVLFPQLQALPQFEGQIQHIRLMVYATIALSIVMAFIYPYSRYGYDVVARFIMGRQLFIVSIIGLLLIKIFRLFVCLNFAMILVPIGLIHLYYSRRNA
jgi:hypothetical protein